MGFRERTGYVLSGWTRLPISRPLPQGLYLARDVKRLLPGLKVKQVFDVGANIGQETIQYTICYPKARIDSFEPVAATYRELVKRVEKGNPNVHCHHLALGDNEGTISMSMEEGSSDRFKVDAAGSEQVQVTTVAKFAADQGIDHINLLKVDTEGFDLTVLHGAERLIVDHRIDLIQVEAGMYPENELHVYFEEFTKYLHGRDYRIFGLYEQTREWKQRYPNLRRANIVFASQRLIESNRI